MTPTHPIAPKIPQTITQHGITRIDEYYWMRDKENPETLKYLRAESDYLDEMLGHTKLLQEKLFLEMKGRIKENDSTVPEKQGGYFYYERMEQGKQYPIFCRKKGSLEAPEEILLDQNALGEGKSFCRVGAFSVSPDGDKLAYSVDFGGREVYTLHIKDLKTGEVAAGPRQLQAGVPAQDKAGDLVFLAPVGEARGRALGVRGRRVTVGKSRRRDLGDLDVTLSQGVVHHRSLHGGSAEGVEVGEGRLPGLGPSGIDTGQEVGHELRLLGRQTGSRARHRLRLRGGGEGQQHGEERDKPSHGHVLSAAPFRGPS